MKLNIQFIIVLICTLLFTQCRKDEIITDTTSNPTEAVSNVSFLLHVTDQSGTAVEDATVTVVSSQENYKTDGNGVVLFQLASIPFEGARISIDHPGYNSLTKRISGVMDSNTKVDIVLTEAKSKIINTGETAELGKGSFTLPSTLQTQEGNNYTGPVLVRYTYLDPENRNFLDAAPGNMLALNNENEYQQLASLGVYSIELSDEQGNELSIPEGNKAIISFPIADVNMGNVPQSIPLWYFDEERDLWIEDGRATVVENMMIAEVTHFTWWNCDLPYDFVPLCMKFVDESGELVSGIEITFSIDGVQYGRAYTDNNGNIITKTPVGTIISISYYIDGEFIGVQDLGPFDESSRKPIVTLVLGITTVSARVLDCDMNPVENGYGVVIINGTTKIFVIVDGTFSFSTAIEGELEITFYDIINGKSTTQTITIDNTVENLIIADIVVCDQTITSGLSGTVMMDTDGDGSVDAPMANSTLIIGGNGAPINVSTNEDGIYEAFLPPGNYDIFIQVVQNEDRTFYGEDITNDGDELDGYKGSVIQCTIETDEIDSGNNFLFLPPSSPSISGMLMIDNDGDGIGDVPLTEGRVIFSFATSNGEVNAPVSSIGTFNMQTLIENRVRDGYLSLDLQGYSPVSDYDESPDPDGDDSADGPNNTIPIRMEYGEMDSDNNFVVKDLQLGSISGTVTEDSNNDDIGDSPIEGMGITLSDIMGAIIASTTTDENGYYQFTGLLAGDYVVSEQDEVEIDEDYVDVYDADESDDGDINDGVLNQDDRIDVTLTEGEDDTDNNFVEEQLGTISGTVTLDTNNDNIGDTPQQAVIVTLKNNSNATTINKTTNSLGEYNFSGLAPGGYTITATDPINSISVSDDDNSPEDTNDNDGIVDNSISVNLVPGEDDNDNDFVDRNN